MSYFVLKAAILVSCSTLVMVSLTYNIIMWWLIILVFPHFVLFLDSQKHEKLSCPPAITAVVSPMSKVATISLRLGEIVHRLSLPVGIYDYKTFNKNTNCSLTVESKGNWLHIYLIAAQLAYTVAGFYLSRRGGSKRLGAQGRQKLKHVCDLHTLKLAKTVKICL